MSTSEKKEILKNKSAIEEYLKVAQEKLEKAKLENDVEGVATATFLVSEYEGMLQEFCQYYGL
jgi:hypothetical protein